MLKFRIVLLFCCFSLLAFPQKDHLKKRITVSAKDERLGEVLKKIANTAKFKLSYNSFLVPEDSIVNVSAKNEQVEDVLNRIFKTSTNQYKSIGNHLVIYRNEKQKTETIEVIVSGFIIDGRTGKKLSKATIYDVNRDVVASSDEMGFYKINLSEKSRFVSLSFCKSGYRDSIIHIKPINQNTNIELIPRYEKIEDLNAKTLEDQTAKLHQRPLVKLIVPADQMESNNNLKLFRKRNLQLSFLPFLGSNGLLSGTVENRISLNAIGGYSRAINGLEVGGFLNIVRENVSGTQVAGFGNIVGNQMNGIQTAGFFNYNIGAVKGIQLAGFSNVATSKLEGFQVAGFINTLNGKMSGAQVSGGLNLTTENVDGLQIAGLTNVSVKDVKLAQVSGIGNYGRNIDGYQLSGIINIATEKVNQIQLSGIANFAQEVENLQVAGILNIASLKNSGVQIAGISNYAQSIDLLQVAGIINITSHENNGGQIAGIINMAGKVKGFQLALVNISDSIYGGIPIGFISLVAKGVHQLEISADELFPINFAFKTGAPLLYNIFKVGVNSSEIYAAYGLGTTWKLNQSLQINFDFLGGALSSGNLSSSGLKTKWNFNPTLSYKLADKFSVAVGPTFNLGISTSNADDVGPYPVNSFSIIEETRSSSITQFWIGAHASVKLF